MEEWDIYDRYRRKTGKTMVRGEAFPEEAYHLVVHVCIFDTKGRLLIQQRQSFKQGWPNLWDVTVGGSALKGEESWQAAQRETWEEVGIVLDLQKERPAFTLSFEHGFDDFYVLEKEVAVEDLSLQYEEVQAAKWADLEEILALIREEQFVPYSSDFIRWLFDCRNCDGFFRKAGGSGSEV